MIRPISCFILFFSTVLCAGAQAGTANLHRIGEYHIGGNGANDGLSYDAASHKVYMSHGSDIEVVDAEKGTILHTIHTGSKTVHAIALAPELGRAFATAAKPGSLNVISTNTSALEKSIPVDDPDSIAYDPFSKRVFAMSSAESAVIDARTATQIGVVHLEGSPEWVATDGKGHLFVNLTDKGVVAVVDTMSLEVTHRYPTDGCTRPHTVDFDSKNNLLFIGCRNGALDVMDASNGNIVARTLICADVDGSAFDPVTRHLFESCGEGAITVIGQNSREEYVLLQTVKTEVEAKTMAYDSRDHRLYLPVAISKDLPSRDPLKPDQFKVPDTLRLLVFGEGK